MGHLSRFLPQAGSELNTSVGGMSQSQSHQWGALEMDWAGIDVLLMICHKRP